MKNNFSFISENDVSKSSNQLEENTGLTGQWRKFNIKVN